MFKMKRFLSLVLCMAVILTCYSGPIYASPEATDVETNIADENSQPETEGSLPEGTTALEEIEIENESDSGSPDSVSDSDTIESEELKPQTEINNDKEEAELEEYSESTVTDEEVEATLTNDALSITAVSANEKFVIDDLATFSVSLEYDDRYNIAELDEDYSIAYIFDQSATSYQVSNGKRGSRDSTVIELDANSDQDIVATGVGTAKMLLVPEDQLSDVSTSIKTYGDSNDDTVIDGLLEEYGTPTVYDWLVAEVKVNPADLTLIFVAGQSNAEGWCSTSTGYVPGDSILCEEGTIYSTYVPHIVYKANQITGLKYSSVDETGANASKFVAGSLAGNTSISGSTLTYPLNALSEEGNGKTGPDSGIAYQWNQLTGDKVWIVNAAWGGTSITNWIPGTVYYDRAEAIFDLAEQTFNAEISAGHYDKGDILMFWVQGEADSSRSASTYVNNFDKMYDGWIDNYDLDGFGIIMVRAAKDNHTTEEDLILTGSRAALYGIGASKQYPKAFIVSNVNEQWVTDSGVSSYFNGKYSGGKLSYETHRSSSPKIPTTVAAVHSDIHYSQIAHNENGLTAADGMYDALYDSSSSVSAVWKNDEYDTVSSIWMAADETVNVACLVSPTYQADNLTYSVSGNAASYEVKSGTITGNRLGTTTIQAKTSTGKTLATLTVTVYNLAAPELVSISAVTNGVQIKWDRVSGADSYGIYRKTPGNSWTQIASVGSTASSYTDTTAKSGLTYVYTVRASKNGTRGSYDTQGLTIDYIEIPTVASLTNRDNGVTISWDAISGAEKYRLYRYTSGSELTVITTTSSTSYTDTSVKSGTTYYYRLRCVDSSGTNFTSSYTTDDRSITYLSVPKLNSVYGNNGGVTAKWSKVSGASSYRVYRKTSGTGWSQIGTTTSTEYKDTTAKTNTTYTYTVRAVKNSSLSNYDSSGKSVKYVATPTVSSLTLTTNGITIKWNAVSGGSKYRIYRHTGDDDDLTLVATVSGTTYTDTSVSSGKPYYYRIRCVNDSGTQFTSGFNTNDKYVYYVKAPVLNSVYGDVGGVTVKWEKSNGASQYRIFRKTNGSSWQAVGTVSSNSNSFKDTSAKTGTTYTYTVRAVNKSGNGYTSSYNSTGLSVSYVGTPTISSLSSNANGIVVRWNAISGANKYRIYRHTGDGALMVVSTRTGTSFTDTSVISGNTYYYRIRCVDSSGTQFTSGYTTNDKGIKKN